MQAPRLTLSQILGPDTAAVPDLPPAPPLDAWLFENPFWLVTALAAFAALALIVGLRRGRPRQGALIGAALALLAAGAFAAGHLVETPRETITARSGQLVQATAAADNTAMRDLLHPDVALRPGGIKFIPEITGRERLLALVGDRIPRAVERVVVLETRAGLDGPRVGRTQVRLRAFGPGGQLYGHSWWRLDWQEHQGQWTAVGIEPLWVQGG